MVLSCFRPVASVIPALSAVLSCRGSLEANSSAQPPPLLSSSRVIFHPLPLRTRLFSCIVLSPSLFLGSLSLSLFDPSAVSLLRFLPSFLPFFLRCNFSSSSHPSTYLLLTSLQPALPSISELSLNARFKREIKFILFIHSRGCRFKLLLSFSYFVSSPTHSICSHFPFFRSHVYYSNYYYFYLLDTTLMTITTITLIKVNANLQRKFTYFLGALLNFSSFLLTICMFFFSTK